MAQSEPQRSERTFSIRDLCREFGATPRALRFYEDRGLLTPSRDGLTRVYSARDRVRLDLILRGKRVGFGLAEIGEMLDLYDRRDGQVAQMAVSVGKFRQRIAALQRQRTDIDDAIVMLEDGCQWLEAKLAIVGADRLANAAGYHDVPRAGLEGGEDDSVLQRGTQGAAQA